MSALSINCSRKMSNARFSQTNVSLVAFYGDKPPELKNLIQQLQGSIDCKSIQNHFIPYQIEQVHGTIIGCEGRKTESGIVNQWFDERRGETRYIDFEGFVDYLQKMQLPLNIRFGGYAPTQKYNFLSRNEHLYFRSFQLQAIEDRVIPILIGWSWNNNRVTLALDNLRRKFQDFNLLHKYHTTPNAMDNDFYLRLGTINTQLSAIEQKAIATKVRNLLANKPALHIPINKKDIALARYRDLSLTPTKTEIVAISDITVERLKQMYST